LYLTFVCFSCLFNNSTPRTAASRDENRKLDPSERMACESMVAQFITDERRQLSFRDAAVARECCAILKVGGFSKCLAVCCISHAMLHAISCFVLFCFSFEIRPHVGCI